MENRILIKKISEEDFDDFFILFKDYPHVTDYSKLIERNHENIFIGKSGDILLGIFGIVKISEEYFSDDFLRQVNISCENFFLESYLLPFKISDYIATVVFDEVIVHSYLIKRKKKFVCDNIEERFQKIYKNIESHKIYKSEIFMKIKKNDLVTVLK